MTKVKFESKSSFDKFSSKTLSNGMFVRENDIVIDDTFLVNKDGDTITLERNGISFFILKDDIKYFVSA